MAKEKFLLINKKNAQRMTGTEDEAEEFGYVIRTWFVKEGDIITGTKDSATGIIKGQVIFDGETDQKGFFEFEAIGEEIGARVKKILIPAKPDAPDEEYDFVDVTKEELRLLLLEVDITKAKVAVDKIKPAEEKKETHTEEIKKKKTTISGQALLVLDEHRKKGGKITIDDILQSLPENTDRVEKEYVEHFLAESERIKPATNEPPASLYVKKLAQKENVRLSEIKGTGRLIAGQPLIRPCDLENHLQQIQTITTAPETPKKTDDEFSEYERKLYDPEIIPVSLHRIGVAKHLRETLGLSDYKPITNLLSELVGMLNEKKVIDKDTALGLVERLNAIGAKKSGMVLAGGKRTVNFTSLLRHRNEIKNDFQKIHGVPLGRYPFLIAAVTQTLKECAKDERETMKGLNCRWEWLEKGAARIVHYRNINIGVALNSPKGLLTPVIRNCQQKTFAEVAKEYHSHNEKVKVGNIPAEHLVGATIIVNNVGALGEEDPRSIPMPKTAVVLSFGKEKKTCECAIECSHPITVAMNITFDHQPLDGEPQSIFMNRVRELLENPSVLLTLSP